MTPSRSPSDRDGEDSLCISFALIGDSAAAGYAVLPLATGLCDRDVCMFITVGPMKKL